MLYFALRALLQGDAARRPSCFVYRLKKVSVSILLFHIFPSLKRSQVRFSCFSYLKWFVQTILSAFQLPVHLRSDVRQGQPWLLQAGEHYFFTFRLLFQLLYVTFYADFTETSAENLLRVHFSSATAVGSDLTGTFLAARQFLNVNDINKQYGSLCR